MKNFKLYSVLALALLVAAGSAATAATNLFGITGGLEAPSDVTMAPGQFSVGYTFGMNAIEDEDANFFDGVVGVVPGLEVGLGFIDPDEGDNATLLNAKYRFLTETVDRPAFTVGVVDIAGDLDIEGDDDPSFFFLVSKTLTGYVEDITNTTSKPLRGHIGFGSGVYDGLIFALDWTYGPRFQADVEYIGGGLNDNDFNALVRFAATPEVRIDVGTLDFNGLTLGINYTSKRF